MNPGDGPHDLARLHLMDAEALMRMLAQVGPSR
jgi:hypothetical protein